MKPILLAKYVIVSLPAMALLAGGTVSIVRPVAAAVAIACALIVLSGPEFWNWYRFRGLEDWRSLTTFVLQRTRPADGVVYNARYAQDSFLDYPAPATVRCRPPSLRMPPCALRRRPTNLACGWSWRPASL